MSITASEVQGVVYTLLKESDFAKTLSGEVYRKGLRPRDSILEDAEVIFTTGTSGEIETGIVTINIYCANIDPYNNGVLTADGERLSELEKGASQWVKSLVASKSNYLFRLQETIHSNADDALKQHFVVVKLEYSYYEVQ